MLRGITTNMLGKQSARGGQDKHDTIVANIEGKGLVDITENLRRSPLVQLAGCYGGVTIPGLTDPEMEVCGTRGDTTPTKVKVTFKVLDAKGKPKSGMWITVVCSVTKLESLPKTHFDVTALKPNELALLTPLISGQQCTSPPDEPYAKVVIAMGGTFVLVKVIPEVSEHRQRLLLLEDQKVKKDAAKALADADKRARAEAARALANARTLLAQQQADARREEDAFAIQVGLQCQALWDFGTVEEMRIADARAKEQQKLAAEAERLRLRREAEQAEKLMKAQQAQQRAAEKEAQAEAERLAKFGSKKGSPPPSSSSSRNASASPPPPSGGKAGRR